MSIGDIGIGAVAAMSAAAGAAIDERTNLPLGTALAVITTVGTIAWRLSSRLKGIEDKINTISDNCVLHRERLQRKEETPK